MAHVVTAFLRHGADVLLVRRSDAVGSYAGRWAGVSGYVEAETDDPLADALREVHEETGIAEAALTLVRRGDPVGVDGEEGEFTVHPFLFNCATRAVDPNEEIADTEWVQPTAMLDRETVPKLWEAYRTVGPTVETVAGDRTHGSAYVSLRALEALRDEAADAALKVGTGHGESWFSVADTARGLRDARPEMTALATRVNRVMSEAERSPTAVRDRATEAVADAVDVDDRAAREVVRVLRDVGHGGDDPAVLTLSRSGTVETALAALDGPVLIAVSEPGGEGRGVAAALAGPTDDDRDGRDGERAVTLLPDAAVASLLAEGRVDAAVVGADAVLPDGSVANKVGTRALALAAAREGVPVYAVAARDKVAPTDEFHPEEAAFETPEGVAAYAPLFDLAPAGTATVVCEDGPLDADSVRAAAEEHRALAGWDADRSDVDGPDDDGRDPGVDDGTE